VLDVQSSTVWADLMGVHVDQVSLTADDTPLDLHDRFTVVGDLDAERRIRLIERFSHAFVGESATTVLWRDSLGEQRTVHRGAPAVPTLFLIDSDDIGERPETDRLLTLLGRARAQTPEPALAVLNEPFAHLPIMRIWELLTVAERLSERLQILLLTSDDVTVAWATHRAQTGVLGLVRYWGADL
jgi:hypothetical protein